MRVCFVGFVLLSVTLPGVELPLSSLGVGPWRQRWAGLWHCSVPTSDEPCCWPERLGLDWASGGLGAWGTGTGPQGNRLLRDGSGEKKINVTERFMVQEKVQLVCIIFILPVWAAV